MARLTRLVCQTGSAPLRMRTAFRKCANACQITSTRTAFVVSLYSCVACKLSSSLYGKCQSVNIRHEWNGINALLLSNHGTLSSKLTFCHETSELQKPANQLVAW